MLVISTATKTAMIALHAKGTTQFCEIDADCRQSEKMMQEIDRLLTKNKLTLDEVGNFGLVIGPGSFTGLRIGAALLKGFCAAMPDKKIVPIPTLDLMAWQVVKDYKPKSNFSCYMKAQSGLFYGATYNKAAEKFVDEHLLTAADVLKGKEQKYCLAEEGFLPYIITVQPQTILEFAEKGEENGNLIHAKDISIKYIRRSAAEEK